MSETPEVYTAGNEKQSLQLSADIVKRYICPLATEQEIYVFLQLCKFQRLNPFLREVYLIKYSSNQPASIVTGKDTFLKRASGNEHYDGFKAGIIISNKAGVQYREGAFLAHGEELLGGWAEVYRKDRSVPIRSEVNFEEYVGRKQDGEMNRQWSSKPATMIRKVPLVQALREAFPDELEGLASPEERPFIDIGALPEYDDGKVLPGHIAPPQSKSQAADNAPATGGNGGKEVKDPDAPISEQQLKAIHAMLGKLNVEDDKRHAYLADVLGLPEVKSTKDITKAQGSLIIDRLNVLLTAGK